MVDEYFNNTGSPGGGNETPKGLFGHPTQLKDTIDNRIVKKIIALSIQNIENKLGCVNLTKI